MSPPQLYHPLRLRPLPLALTPGLCIRPGLGSESDSTQLELALEGSRVEHLVPRVCLPASAADPTMRPVAPISLTLQALMRKS